MRLKKLSILDTVCLYDDYYYGKGVKTLPDGSKYEGVWRRRKDDIISKWKIKGYDKNGKIALSGKINKQIVREALTWTYTQDSYDIKDFNNTFWFFKKLSLKDGAASLAEYTAETISNYDFYLVNAAWNKNLHFLISGGGRKNNFLFNRIKKKIIKSVKLIDNLGIDGDFIESQAFAYLAIRSYLKLPISFPETTGVSKPSTGGIIIKNI